MIYLKLETAGTLDAVNEDPNRRDGYVEVERDGDCRRVVLTPGERKRLKLNPGAVLVRWTVGMKVTPCI